MNLLRSPLTSLLLAGVNDSGDEPVTRKILYDAVDAILNGMDKMVGELRKRWRNDRLLHSGKSGCIMHSVID